jgi:hypothetical protein
MGSLKKERKKWKISEMIGIVEMKVLGKIPEMIGIVEMKVLGKIPEMIGTVEERKKQTENL